MIAEQLHTVIPIDDALTLRPLKASDRQALKEMAEHPVMRDWLDSEGFTGTAEDLMDLYYGEKHAYLKKWVILSGSENRLVGIVDLYPLTPHHLVYKHDEIGENTFCLGVWIDPDCHRQAIATRALKALIKHCFAVQPELEWMQASCFESHKASRRLLEKAGMHFFTIKDFEGQNDSCYVINRDPHFDYNSLKPNRPANDKVNENPRDCTPG